MRWFTCLGLGLALTASTTASGEHPLTAAARLQQHYPNVQFNADGERVQNVFGSPFGFGASAGAVAEQFRLEHAAVFGAESAELMPLDEATGGDPIVPVMYEPETGSHKFTLVRYAQIRDGIPVFRATLKLLIRNTDGSPLVWAGSTLRDLGTFAVPRSVPDSSLGELAALAILPNLTNITPPQLTIYAGVNDVVVAPTLAYEFTADDLADPSAETPGDWLFVTDAQSGEILYRESRIHFTDVSGSVHGMATEGPKSDNCADEVSMPMPWTQVSISGGSSVWADGNGNFTIPNGGTAAVTVQSPMTGHYFTVDNSAGSEETLSLSVTPPGPANFLHNADNTSEQIRAQVNAYVQANRIRDWVLVQNPSYPTIAGETGFSIYVNRSDLYCPGNAWSSGTTINFCLAASGYPNTAYSSVVHHEYGHHMVDCAGSGQGQYGEGIGDCVAVLLADDPTLGYGFTGNCNTGLRTADNTYQYPCTSDIHDCAQLLSGCVWSTRNELHATNPSDYLSILSELTVNSILLHNGESITPQITNDFLTLDDDDGDLGNGTPHYDQITTGFGAHNMWAGPPPENDNCAQAAVACPGAYAASTVGMTVDGSAGCGSTGSAPDVWYKYTPATSGTLHLAFCSSDYDTVVSVHTGCPGTSSNQVGCNDDSGWLSECSWLPTDQSLLDVSVSASVTYYIRISGASGAAGNYVMELSGPACVPTDTTPPSPNPMTFAVAPAPISASAINMTATTATDAGSPPVQYEFEFVSGGAGGTSSAWQASTTYMDDGLAANTSYTYHVRARDSASPPNVTGFSANATATTLALVPAAPTLSDPTPGTLKLDVNANGNPSYTVFAVRCTGTSPADAAWDGKYVDAAGNPSATAVWQTDSQWATLTVQGLHFNTAYTFAVKARNLESVETAFGTGATLSTVGILGDLNCDGVIDNFDINPFVLALTNPAGYAATYPNCDSDLADINGDTVVDNFDINPFVDLLTGG